MFKPLEGIKVVDFTLAGSGPSGTMILVQMGAEVTWVEPLQGNSTRSIHELNYYSSGKRSITLDVKNPKGLETMYRLIKDADVFCTNYRMKSVKKLGLGYDKLKEINPRLVYSYLTGWGDGGPKANDAGFDTVCYWARGGMMQDIAEAGTLVVPPIAIGDINTGESMVLGVLAGLYKRSITGVGCEASTSILAQAIYSNHDAVIETQFGEKYPKSRLAPRRALLNTYQCSDGKWLVVNATAHFEKNFNALLKLIGHEDLIGDSRWPRVEDTMYEHAPELVKILDEGFAKVTRDEALEYLTANDVACEAVAGTADILTDPQALENGYLWPYTERRDGKTRLYPPMSPVCFNGEQGARTIPPAPYLGEHSVQILRELGYNDAEIKEMLETGVTNVTNIEYTVDI